MKETLEISKTDIKRSSWLSSLSSYFFPSFNTPPAFCGVRLSGGAGDISRQKAALEQELSLEERLLARRIALGWLIEGTLLVDSLGFGKVEKCIENICEFTGEDLIVFDCAEEKSKSVFRKHTSCLSLEDLSAHLQAGGQRNVLVLRNPFSYEDSLKRSIRSLILNHLFKENGETGSMTFPMHYRDNQTRLVCLQDSTSSIKKIPLLPYFAMQRFINLRESQGVSEINCLPGDPLSRYDASSLPANLKELEWCSEFQFTVRLFKESLAAINYLKGQYGAVTGEIISVVSILNMKRRDLKSLLPAPWKGQLRRPLWKFYNFLYWIASLRLKKFS